VEETFVVERPRTDGLVPMLLLSTLSSANSDWIGRNGGIKKTAPNPVAVTMAVQILMVSRNPPWSSRACSKKGHVEPTTFLAEKTTPYAVERWRPSPKMSPRESMQGL
jgi:hypothetical protein